MVNKECTLKVNFISCNLAERIKEIMLAASC